MSLISEGLNFKDMVGLVKPTIHVDEFVSKMGDDDEIAVLSFFVRNDAVANDLVKWFEKGYDFVLDADRSPGEVSPNRYLVYIEVERRTRLIKQIKELLEDFETLTEFNIDDWVITVGDEETHFDEDRLHQLLILSPRQYREEVEGELNEMRTAANLPTKPQYDKKRSKDLDSMRSIAGLL